MMKEIQDLVQKVENETEKIIVGQKQLIRNILMAFLIKGHVLLEGVPGLGKTLTCKTIAQILGLDFKRIQFTPDLLPADITGTLIYEQSKGSFSVRKGPIFSNIILADEINRAPAKVQSAMLEAMEERQVTIGEKTYPLPQNFFVLATQNPIEQEGTYNLPEAELDRFLMKLVIDYPESEDEIKIIQSQTQKKNFNINPIITPENLQKITDAINNVNCDESIIKYIVSILSVTRANSLSTNNEMKKNINKPQSFSTTFSTNNDITRFITLGASPRAGIAMLQCAKVNAIFEGRDFVLPEDIKKIAGNVLRHRITLSYEALADNVTADEIITRILDAIPLP